MTGAALRRPESVLVVVYATPPGSPVATPNPLQPEGGQPAGLGGCAWADAQVLLLERRDMPGFWQSVTGSLEQGETPAQAARRELAEETGLEGEPVDLGESRRFEIFPELRHRFPPGVTHNLEHAFAIRLEVAGPVAINRDEHRGYRWLPWRDAAALAGSWTNREAIESLLGGREVRP